MFRRQTSGCACVDRSRRARSPKFAVLFVIPPTWNCDMRRIYAAILVGLITLVTVTAQEPQPGEPEVLTRGPIHEAYATSPSATPQPGPIAQKAPPQPIEELPPEQKPEGDVVFIPGYWS